MLSIRNRLRSSQGIDIAISYVSELLVDSSSAEIWIAVSPAVIAEAPPWVLPPDAEVEAVLVPRVFVNGAFARYETVSVPLVLDTATASSVRFIAAFGDWLCVARRASDETMESHPQIALRVNGDWQRDPMQHGLHNFNFAWMLDEG